MKSAMTCMHSIYRQMIAPVMMNPVLRKINRFFVFSYNSTPFLPISVALVFNFAKKFAIFFAIFFVFAILNTSWEKAISYHLSSHPVISSIYIISKEIKKWK